MAFLAVGGGILAEDTTGLELAGGAAADLKEDGGAMGATLRSLDEPKSFLAVGLGAGGGGATVTLVLEVASRDESLGMDDDLGMPLPFTSAREAEETRDVVEVEVPIKDATPCFILPKKPNLPVAPLVSGTGHRERPSWSEQLRQRSKLEY